MITAHTVYDPPSQTVVNKEWDVVRPCSWSYWNSPVCEQMRLQPHGADSGIIRAQRETKEDDIEGRLPSLLPLLDHTHSLRSNASTASSSPSHALFLSGAAAAGHGHRSGKRTTYNFREKGI
ncbi:hypothetical protein JOB18_012541 [Solea senegalensis]|uniref:Uncharacterized protein n=1 Tax=Solea senegalensis TaxID=28829 RepID=A0AAV6PSN0_SOLSE|nr:hypothetical protein JOB18_012541 [Solea senegalensis]